jgi:hypothetical protein
MAFSRELHSDFTVEVACVDRLAHRLLAQDDLAMPLDIYDKKAGIDYFTAETAVRSSVYRRPRLHSLSTNGRLSFRTESAE